MSDAMCDVNVYMYTMCDVRWWSVQCLMF